MPSPFTNLIIIAGYCVGPLAWGPLSEQYGRRPIFVISFGLYTVRALNFITFQLYYIYLYILGPIWDHPDPANCLRDCTQRASSAHLSLPWWVFCCCTAYKLRRDTCGHVSQLICAHNTLPPTECFVLVGTMIPEVPQWPFLFLPPSPGLHLAQQLEGTSPSLVSLGGGCSGFWSYSRECVMP